MNYHFNAFGYGKANGDDLRKVIEEIAKRWPSPVVARCKVEEFSGGFLHPRTMANLDSRGDGPRRFRYGRKVAYPLGGPNGLVEWMLRRHGPTSGEEGGCNAWLRYQPN